MHASVPSRKEGSSANYSAAPTAATQSDQYCCPDCGSFVSTTDTSESVCSDCDVVVNDSPTSIAPRPVDAESDRSTKKQTGGTVTNLSADRCIGVDVQTNARTNGRGNRLSRTQQRIVRQKPWTHHRDSTDVTLDYALAEMRRMGEALDVPRPELEEAARFYHRAFKNDLIVGRSVDGFATACLLITVRQSPVRIPVSTAELSGVTRATAAQVRTARGVMELELGIKLPLMDPRDFVPRAVSKLSAPPAVRACASRLLHAHITDDERQSRGLSPRTLAAAAVHAAYELVGVNARPTLAEVSDVTGVSVGTISQRKGCLSRYAEGE